MLRVAGLLLVVLTVLPAAESLRWLAGPGSLGGQPAMAGAAVGMESLLAAGDAPVLVDLGRGMTGLLVLAPGAQVVPSVDGRDLILRVMAGRAEVRLAGPGTCGRLRLRNERGEAKLTSGLIMAEAGGALVLVEGQAEVRGVGSEGRASPWSSLVARQATATPGGEVVPVVLRPQLIDLPLLEQAEGRRPPPPTAATGLDPWQRDDAVVQALGRLLDRQDPTGLTALRVVAPWEAASALLVQQQAIAAAPDAAVPVTLAVAKANPGIAPLAVVGAVLVVPGQRVALVDAAITALPERKEAILAALYAVFPALAPPPPPPPPVPLTPEELKAREVRSKIDDTGVFLAPNQVHPFFR